MRIISGLAKGRTLDAPIGRSTRPTADRVKEAIFSTIAVKIADARVLDAFAGTGALGLEALSRGAKEVVFTENSHAAFIVLDKNITTVGLPGALAVRGDCLKMISRWQSEGRQFELIFLDPPYNKGLLGKVVPAILGANLLAEDGLLVVERDGDKNEIFPEDALELVKEARYGDISVSYYVRI